MCLIKPNEFRYYVHHLIILKSSSLCSTYDDHFLIAHVFRIKLHKRSLHKRRSGSQGLAQNATKCPGGTQKGINREIWI